MVKIEIDSIWAASTYPRSKYTYKVTQVEPTVAYFCVQFPGSKFKLDAETFLRRFKPAE